jgi:hypothetical protein
MEALVRTRGRSYLLSRWKLTFDAHIAASLNEDSSYHAGQMPNGSKEQKQSRQVVEMKSPSRSSARKLKPTHVERTAYGEGDGSDLRVVDTAFGRLGRARGNSHVDLTGDRHGHACAVQS